MSPRPLTSATEPERTLSERELNRALLARQHLLERATTAVPKAIERVGGLQTQYAPAGYIPLETLSVPAVCDVEWNNEARNER